MDVWLPKKPPSGAMLSGMMVIAVGATVGGTNVKGCSPRKQPFTGGRGVRDPRQGWRPYVELPRIAKCRIARCQIVRCQIAR